MTHAEMILSAVNEFRKQGVFSFSREDIRASLGINSEDWLASYSPVFQGMRLDQPGGAPAVGERFRNVFRRVRRGVYVLTDYGISVIELRFDQHATAIPENEEIINLANLNPPRVTQPSHPQQTHSYSEKVQTILRNAEIYHQAYYQSEIFGKPCLYYHLQALNTRQNPTSVKHLEYVYATLVAWGMNRPGKNGAKMRDFETFFQSFQSLNEYILKAQTFDCCYLDEDKWAIVERIFKGIQVMDSRTSLVGNSKVMHHMLPNVIPPIDRTYTLSFLHGNTNIINNINHEWELMKEIITYFFIPVASDDKFQSLANEWMKRGSEYPWDTSILKIIDNIIVGAKE